MITREHKLLDGTARRAVYSDDEWHRFRLDVIWGPEKPINFIMLNPSTATEERDDPTVARCVTRARGLGAGGLIVTNLFAYRATDPRELKRLKIYDSIGGGNHLFIMQAIKDSSLVVCGWGSHGGEIGLIVRDWLRGAGVKLHVLKLTKEGAPAHPLYLGYDLKPVPWT